MLLKYVSMENGCLIKHPEQLMAPDDISSRWDNYEDDPEFKKRMEIEYAKVKEYYRIPNRIKRGSKIVLKVLLWILVFFFATCIITMIPSDPERDRDYYEDNINRLW